MDQESEVDLSNLAITPLWRKRRPIPKSPNMRSLNRRSKARPCSYQIDGILVTDFPADGNIPTQNGNIASPPDGHLLLQRQLSTHSLPTPDKQRLVLSTDSAVSLKNGTQQIIPKDLASAIKIKNHHQNNQNLEFRTRSRRVQSMVETVHDPLVPKLELDGDTDPDLECPGQLRRGLRSTSYRRAVVSGVHFDNSSSVKNNNRRSQPNLKTVLEDKEKFPSLCRGKVLSLKMKWAIRHRSTTLRILSLLMKLVLSGVCVLDLSRREASVSLARLMLIAVNRVVTLKETMIPSSFTNV